MKNTMTLLTKAKTPLPKQNRLYRSKNAFTEAKAFFENRLTGFFNQFVKDLNLFFRTRVIIAQRKRNVHLLIF